jgi:hypothetical protein
MKFGMKYETMTAEDHAARAQAYAWLKASGYRQRGRKTQRQRAAEVARVVTAALRAAGLTVVDLVSEPSEQEKWEWRTPLFAMSAVEQAEYELFEARQRAYWKREDERHKAGGYYVVRHDYKHGPMPEVEYLPTPAERAEWKLPGSWEMTHEEIAAEVARARATG